jgi:hypothetical protein
VTAIVGDAESGKQMEAMFEADFPDAVVIEEGFTQNKPFCWRLAVSLSRLAAPVL